MLKAIFQFWNRISNIKKNLVNPGFIDPSLRIIQINLGQLKVGCLQPITTIYSHYRHAMEFYCINAHNVIKWKMLYNYGTTSRNYQPQIRLIVRSGLIRKIRRHIQRRSCLYHTREPIPAERSHATLVFPQVGKNRGHKNSMDTHTPPGHMCSHSYKFLCERAVLNRNK